MQSNGFPAVPPPAADDEDAMDDLYQVLSNQRRQAILRDLHESEDDRSLDELDERITRERRTPANGFHDDVASVRSSLYHIPVLARTNLVEYDVSRRTIEFRSPTGER